jgi:hypothetical protein
MLVSSPFNPRLHMVFDPRGAIWWGECDEYRIEHRFIEGGTVTRIHREHTAGAVSATEVDEWLASEGIRRFRERGGQPDASALQKEKPVFDGLFLDDRGYLWVRVVTVGEAPVYDVFDADGRYLGAVTGVAGMSGLAPIIVGDRFYAVIRGEYDVPYVARYRIRGRS